MSHPISGSLVTNSQPTELVKDYLLVPQNSENRPTWYASSDLYTGLATTVETAFDFNAFDFFLPIGGGPPLHYHRLDHEVWYLVEGDIWFGFGNQAGEGGFVEPKYKLANVVPGTVVFGPRLRTHVYGNIDSTDAVVGENVGARTFNMTTPGGLDLYFDYLGVPVEDRNEQVPDAAPPTPEIWQKILEIGARISGNLPTADYEPPEGTPDYIVILPNNPPQELVDQLVAVDEIEGFSIWQKDNDPNIDLPNRPTFTGAFGYEHVSLLNLEETGGEFTYSEFSMEPETTEVFAGAKLTAGQVVDYSDSIATGMATVSLDEDGNIDYSLTITGLDFGQFLGSGTPQTPEEEDDVTGLHIHSGARGSTGPHEFSILDFTEQDETDVTITQNQDGSTIISGSWSQTENDIPTSLIDFLSEGGLPGQESEFYFQVHTNEHPKGELRGQIALSTNDFPEPIVSENHEVLYIKEGEMSIEINGEARLAHKDDFIYIAPGNEYSIGNFSQETVEAIASTIINLEQDTSIPSPLSPLPPLVPEEIITLTDESDIFNEANGTKREINGLKGNDVIVANQSDTVRGNKGRDILDASRGQGENRLLGGGGDDIILVKESDRAFGGKGDDFLDASPGTGQNGLWGGEGNDSLFASEYDLLKGGEGNDELYISTGGHNVLYGGTGADLFFLINNVIPETVHETRQDIEVPPFLEPLPHLEDTRNAIGDFELGVDKIVIRGINGIHSFEDLKLAPAFDDAYSTSIVAPNIEGIEGETSLGNLQGIVFSQLSADDFVIL